MRSLVKLLIYDKGIRSTPSIYISILLAYLEIHNGDEASKMSEIVNSLEMKPEEEGAFDYLKPIVLNKDEVKLAELLIYLKA